MLNRHAVGRVSRFMLVGCNIYISAGKPTFAPVLLKLLEDAQRECTRLRSISQSSSLVVVHAYADAPYDRSSFHIAGSPTLVASLASHIAVQTLEGLADFRQAVSSSKQSINQETTHPTVGLVDHVSILPLQNTYHVLSGNEWAEVLSDQAGGNSDLGVSCAEELSSMEPTLPAGWVARTVGNEMTKLGAQVFLYGHADPDKTPLARVRKERTKFFHGLPVDDGGDISQKGQATVGAPPSFVENYNIEIASHDRKVAQSLTKWVRSRDGGLPQVEALTLPYGRTEEGVPIYEIACNLLDPVITSTEDIDRRVEEWRRQDKRLPNIIRSYRVGTTAQMCHDALEATATNQGMTMHNAKILQNLGKFLEENGTTP